MHLNNEFPSSSWIMCISLIENITLDSVVQVSWKGSKVLRWCHMLLPWLRERKQQNNLSAFVYIDNICMFKVKKIVCSLPGTDSTLKEFALLFFLLN